ncbi:hypothetical protein Dimus_005703 [Dionaea muscipula]
MRQTNRNVSGPKALARDLLLLIPPGSSKPCPGSLLGRTWFSPRSPASGEPCSPPVPCPGEPGSPLIPCRDPYRDPCRENPVLPLFLAETLASDPFRENPVLPLFLAQDPCPREPSSPSVPCLGSLSGILAWENLVPPPVPCPGFLPGEPSPSPVPYL